LVGRRATSEHRSGRPDLGADARQAQPSGDTPGAGADGGLRHRQQAVQRDITRSLGEKGVERRSEPDERGLVGAQGPPQGVLPQRGDGGRCPDDDPGLRARQELVAGEQDGIRTGGENFLRGRLVPQPVDPKFVS
jgi:hypothetical protein